MIENYKYLSIIGAQRCGTTWLYSMLDQHPEIFMAKPIRPEPKFFLNDEAVKAGREAYVQKYFGDTQAAVIGEKSTSYLESPAAGTHIKYFFPNAKILIMLRDPVERAISNYYFSVKNGLETRSIENVFINESPAPELKSKISVNPFDYLSRGEYYRYIKSYRDIFPEENIYVIINEKITMDRGVLAALYRFLGVDDSYVAVGFDALLNTSYEDKPVPGAVRRKIQQHYKSGIHSLSRYVDVSCWGLDV